jgi:hypothetical protein
MSVAIAIVDDIYGKMAVLINAMERKIAFEWRMGSNGFG